jgi:hypothetical protein
MRELPQPGYYWAPAGMEQLYYSTLAKRPSTGSYKPHSYKKFIDGCKASVRIMEGMGHRLAYSAKINIKGGWYPGRELLARTHFGLYNALDKSFKDSHIILSGHLAKICYRIQDSGGFQLFTGAKDFIDPVQLAKLHDVFADSGVGLDLPMSLVDNKQLVAAGARMMVANSITLAEHRKAKWALMNVSHGLTPSLREEWQRIALRNPLDSLCIAGLRGSIHASAVGANPVAIAVHMLIGMLYPADYQHYHLLGLSSVIGMALAAFVANLHQKVVTSDSTTWLNGQMFKNFINGSVSSAKDNYGRIKCSCSVCNFIEYEHWLNELPTLISLHNAEQINKTCQTLNGLSKIALAKKLKGPDVARMFFFANVGIEKQNVPALGRAFSLLLNIKDYKAACSIDYSVKLTQTGSLFDQKSTPKEDYSRFVKIIKRYEKYHKTRFFENRK